MSSSQSSSYMGAFHEFVESKPEETRRQQQQCQKGESSELEQDATEKPASVSEVKKGSVKRKAKSDDDTEETDDADSDSDSNEDANSSSSEQHSEPPAVPKRPRTQRTAKQKVLSKMSSRGRGRGSSWCLFTAADRCMMTMLHIEPVLVTACINLITVCQYTA